MKKLSTELKVGAFAIIVLVILTFMTFKVGGFEWIKEKGYVIYVEFKDIGGLGEKTKIKIAGVDSGIIKKVELEGGKAKLTLRINKDVVLYSDAAAAIKSTGFLGDKYLEINIGSQKPVLKNGDTIKNVEEAVNFDDLVKNLSNVSSNIGTFASALNESIGTPEGKEALKESVQNLRDITERLKETISVNDKKMRDALDNINNLVASINDLVQENKEPITTTVGNIKDFSASLKKDGPELVANLNKATKEFKEMVEENRPAIKSTTESIGNIAKKVEQGEGTLGKLIKDDRLYESVNKAAEGINKTVSTVERFRTFLTFQTDYLTKPRDARGYFYVTLQPTPDKYYILGIVSDPIARVTTKETITTPPGTSVTEEEIQKRIVFTAQFAKRFSDLALRIGLTENTFGVGGDYFFLNDKAKFSVDVWDFSGDEEGAKHAHVKAGIDYFIFKNVFLTAGADNIFNANRRGAYVGGGFRFEDEDLKYLFGTLPRISTR